jgi:hypothetical protein
MRLASSYLSTCVGEGWDGPTSIFRILTLTLGSRYPNRIVCFFLGASSSLRLGWVTSEKRLFPIGLPLAEKLNEPAAAAIFAESRLR